MNRDRPKQVESVQRIEPAHLENPPEQIADLVADLSAFTARLGRSLHPRTATNLADLVRVMNTHYSNLIEGHNTRPRDIERALAGDLDSRGEGRSLQIEAAAHVRLQSEIDRLGAEGGLGEPASLEFIQWLHREFYRGTPPSMRRVRGVSRDVVMVAGLWRSSPQHNVAVGRHVPPSSDRVDDFMHYFAERYRLAAMGKASRIIAMASAHHRFNYIHPFPDGNGRVSRLMSHAMAWSADIAAHGLWSISRGLARGLANRDEYTQMMDLADTPRQSDTDGRGNLSRRALVEFVNWFLRIAIDQVTFMSSVFDLDTLAGRLRSFAERQELGPHAARLLEYTLVRGEVERGEAVRVIGLPERSGRRVLNEVIGAKLLASSSPKGPVSLRFPANALEVLFPNLYGPMTGDPESIDEQLRHAIENTRLIEVIYNGKRRVVEPHDYGVHSGEERLLVYQLRTVPPSAGRPTSGWRLLDVAKIQNCYVLSESFPGSRGHAHRKHVAWEILYARVS